MPDLAASLRAVVDGAAAPVTIEEVRARTLAPRPRRSLLLAAAAVLVVVLAAASVRWAGGDDRVVAGPADPATTTAGGDGAWQPSSGPTRTAPPVPDGWLLVDVGPVRFGLPPGWVVPFSAGCAYGDGPVVGVVLVPAASAGGGCQPAQPPPADVLAFTAGPAAGPGTPTTLGAIDALAHPAPQCTGCPRSFTLPDGTVVTATGTDVDAVLATFTDAGWRQVLQDGPLATTEGWQTVTAAGIAFDVPPAWEVVDLPASYTETTGPGGAVVEVSSQLDPGACGGPRFPPDRPPRVSIGRMSLSPSCPATLSFGVAAGDGAWVRADEAGSPAPTVVARRTVHGLAVDAVRATEAEGSPTDPSLDLVVHGPTGPVRLAVGVGQDPAVARAVVASIRPA